MKKGKFTILIILLLAMIGLTSGLIAAWLTDTKTTPPTTFTVGDVKYTWNGTTVSDGTPIVPGQNLIVDLFHLTNESTIDSELRVKIIANYTLEGETESHDALHLFKDLSLMSGWVYKDEFWYYEPEGISTIAPTVTTVNVIDTLILDGSQVGNTYSKAAFTIQFIFEAKQKDYVTWEELGNARIDFSTGI